MNGRVISLDAGIPSLLTTMLLCIFFMQLGLTFMRDTSHIVTHLSILNNELISLFSAKVAIKEWVWVQGRGRKRKLRVGEKEAPQTVYLWKKERKR